MKRRLLLCFGFVFIMFVVYLMFVINSQNKEIELLHFQNNNLMKTYKSELKEQQLQMIEIQKEVDVIKKKRFLTSKDIKALEKITEVEATNQGLRGKALVASVVLNRLIEGNYKSVHQVIIAPGQFSPVSQGKYYNAVPTDETKKAVEMAISKDYSRGSLYFMNPEISSRGNVNWFRNSLRLKLRYGDHEFYVQQK